MKFRKVLSSVLLGVSLMNNMHSSAIDEDLKRVITHPLTKTIALCASVGTVGYVIGRYNSWKKNNEIAKRTKVCEKLPNGIVKTIATQLLELIPISESGINIFEQLIKCNSEKDIHKWAEISVATKGFNSTTLINIDYILKAHKIVSVNLLAQAERAFNKELAESKNKQNKTSWADHLRLVYDVRNGFHPQIIF